MEFKSSDSVYLRGNEWRLCRGLISAGLRESSDVLVCNLHWMPYLCTFWKDRKTVRSLKILVSLSAMEIASEIHDAVSSEQRATH